MNDRSIVVFLESGIPCFRFKERHVERLQQAWPKVEIIWCRDRESFIEALPRAEAVLSWQFEQEWFEKSPLLKKLGTPAAGRDFFKISSLPEHVEIRNGAFHGAIMAETAVGMILAVNRGILRAYREQSHDNLWPRQQLFDSRLIYDTHAVILGFGRIGQRIGEMLKPFGVRVTGVRRNPNMDAPGWFERGDEVRAVDDLRHLLATADHVVMVLPSDTGTDNFIGRAEFDVMPAHAVVYNFGRGNSIDEEALANALRTGSIAGAGLDVFAQEPLPESSPLADNSLPGLLRMPHAAAFCEDYIDRFLDEISDWLGEVAP